MLINFQKHRQKKESEAAYREQLMGQIISLHANRPDGEASDSFYFQHIREQFPTEALEEILRKLQNRASNE